MEATIETTNTTPRADTTAPANEEAGTAAPTIEGANEIRGMMPSFHVWHQAQHALAFERFGRALAADVHDDDRPSGTRRRWPLVLAAVAIIAGALLLERARGTESAQLAGAAPVEQMPWNGFDAPSGAFHVSLPAKPTTHTVLTAAGSGEQLEVHIPQANIAVSAFPVVGPNQARELVPTILEERAKALDGKVVNLRPVGSRTGAAFEGEIRTSTPVAVVRVVVDGAMLYVIELRGDVESARTRQIYDRVVLSFTAGT